MQHNRQILPGVQHRIRIGQPVNDSVALAVDKAIRLLEQVASVFYLARAPLCVARNKGAAGVDERSVEKVVNDPPQRLP